MYNATKVLMRDGVGQFGCQFIPTRKMRQYLKHAHIARRALEAWARIEKLTGEFHNV